MATIELRGGGNGGGVSISGAISRTVAVGYGADVSTPAGNAGTLSTYTDTNTGVVTLATGHTIATGNKVSIFWTGGSRYGVTVGTVTVNSVPIDLGAGTNLPIQGTAVVVCLEVVEVIGIVGNDLKALSVGSGSPQSRVSVDFRDASHASLWRVDVAKGESVDWVYGCPFTNPLAGVTVAEIGVAQNETTASRAVVIVGTDSA